MSMALILNSAAKTMATCRGLAATAAAPLMPICRGVEDTVLSAIVVVAGRTLTCFAPT